ncbi:MAG: UDP-N-acetyl-D-glucosamine dehydrogenase [Pseudonocardia sp.]|jgi:UDP-N-acetyl-D-glucosamine dehydrogenase|nr:UDP-N-acetyl-D-glucosamine dehydrogenase [Pseudonocardia sp.]MDT7614252.1 UDP-N-acetyl-D-glucosamine dehydrogenase [Pseudonocardiales bacterium]
MVTAASVGHSHQSETPDRVPSRSGAASPDPGASMSASPEHLPPAAEALDLRLCVTGLGHVGLAFARDAVAAGFRTIGFGGEPGNVVRLVSQLADSDATAAALSTALARGHCRITDDPGACSGFDVAVVAPGTSPEDPTGAVALEAAAVAIAPHVRPGTLVIVHGAARVGEQGELLAATVELLTGLRAGRDYDLGFAVAPSGAGPAGLTIASGLDDVSARRAAELLRSLGRDAAVVVPVEAAELVALLQHALHIGKVRP